MTVCAIPAYIEKYKKEIDFLKGYDAKSAPPGVLNLACAISLGMDVLFFDEERVVVKSNDSSSENLKDFNIFRDPGVFLDILSTGEYVLSGNSQSLPVQILDPENSQIKRLNQRFSVHSGVSATSFDGSDIVSALACSVFLRVMFDVKYFDPTFYNDQEDEFREMKARSLKARF